MEEQKDYLGSGEQPLIPPTQDEKTMAILAHVLTLFAWFIPPLVIYILKKDDSSYIAHHARESLNFQITIGIIAIVLAITIVGILLIWPLGVVALVLIIIATIRANDGKLYKYPINWRVIK